MKSGRGGKPGTRNAAKSGPKRAQGPRIREDLLAAAKAAAQSEGIKIGLWMDEAIRRTLEC